MHGELSRSAMSDSATHGLRPTSLLCLSDFSGRNTGGGHHALLQGIFPGGKTRDRTHISCVSCTGRWLPIESRGKLKKWVERQTTDDQARLGKAKAIQWMLFCIGRERGKYSG